MHALIQTDTLTDNGQRHEFGADALPDLSHKNPPLKWVPVVIAADPAFDPATEKLQRAADVITLTELTESREIVAKTAEEQAAYVDNQDRNAKRSAVGGSVATLRQWALDAQGTTVTSGNAVATLQQTVDRLGVFFDRFADLIEGDRIDQQL